jgi:hypothetical protein
VVVVIIIIIIIVAVFILVYDKSNLLLPHLSRFLSSRQGLKPLSFFLFFLASIQQP